jgi:hypothetical protein
VGGAGELADVEQVASGGFHACALAGGQVSCWGSLFFANCRPTPCTTPVAVEF